jgi:hypothetical protein
MDVSHTREPLGEHSVESPHESPIFALQAGASATANISAVSQRKRTLARVAPIERSGTDGKGRCAGEVKRRSIESPSLLHAPWITNRGQAASRSARDTRTVLPSRPEDAAQPARLTLTSVSRSAAPMLRAAVR